MVLSIPDFFRKGFRSVKAPVLQNLPTLSVVKEATTSGALSPPARSAWLILSSVMLPVTLTLMFGCAFWNRAMLSSMALISLGADQPCQKLRVTSLFGSSEAVLEAEPVHAVASTDSAATATAAAVRRRVLGMTESLSARGDFLEGWCGWVYGAACAGGCARGGRCRWGERCGWCGAGWWWGRRFGSPGVRQSGGRGSGSPGVRGPGAGGPAVPGSGGWARFSGGRCRRPRPGWPRGPAPVPRAARAVPVPLR